jgi:hypothetical protein
LFAGWIALFSLVMVAVPNKSAYLIVVVMFLPFFLGVAIYWLSAKNFGEFAMRRYERLAERLLGSSDRNPK